MSGVDGVESIVVVVLEPPAMKSRLMQKVHVVDAMYE